MEEREGRAGRALAAAQAAADEHRCARESAERERDGLQVRLTNLPPTS